MNGDKEGKYWNIILICPLLLYSGGDEYETRNLLQHVNIEMVHSERPNEKYLLCSLPRLDVDETQSENNSEDCFSEVIVENRKYINPVQIGDKGEHWLVASLKTKDPNSPNGGYLISRKFRISTFRV